MSWVFIAWLIPMAIGGAFLAYLKFTNSEIKFIPWTGIAVAVVLFFSAWGIVALGTHLSIQSAVTFHENLNGFERAAVRNTTTCSEDGPCVHEYDCDPYQVKVVDQEAYTDKDGHYHPEEYHYKTEYHSCPYTTEEYTFVVQTTLGDYTIASHWLPADPNQHRWRSGHNVPSGYPSGTPQFWEQARDRIAAGDPGPVTKRSDYENYILASQDTILKQYSDSIDRYRKAKLMPDLSDDPIIDPYYENKVFFEGLSAPPGDWQMALNRFDSALGTDLQGDMYVVVVDANKVTDPDDYILALDAYWTSSKYFGKDALSKNGIIVVVGTKDGKTVDWARAKTGMPVGNEALLLDIRDKLPGTALTPDALLGHPRATRLYIKSGEHHYSAEIAHTNGALENIAWGEHKFQRVCMECTTPGDQGVGYQYLKNEIQPGFWARFWMDFFTLLVGAGLWFGAFAFSDPTITDGLTTGVRRSRW